MRLQIGDKLRVPVRLGVYHYGIYVGPCGPYGEDVVHNDKGGGVQLVGFRIFAAGQPVQVVSRARSWYEGWVIRDRALSLVGTRYDLLNFNCEHAANYAEAGVAFSPTLRGSAFLGLVGGLVWWASGKS